MCSKTDVCDIPFSGSFLWSENSTNESKLIAPSMSISTTSCLSFKYYISEHGMLKLYSNLTSIWSISNVTKSRWRSGQVQLTNKDDSFRLSKHDVVEIDILGAINLLSLVLFSDHKKDPEKGISDSITQ
jgi:hypothetical protein